MAKKAAEKTTEKKPKDSGHDNRRTYNGQIPEGFVLDKPKEQKTYKERLIYQLEKLGELIITRKRNGWKCFLNVDSLGRVSLYTDGLNRIDDYKVADILLEAEKLYIPACSFLPGEIIESYSTDADDRGVIGGLISSGEKKAEEMIERGVKPHLALFNVIFWGGERVTTAYSETFEFMEKQFKGEYIRPVERLTCPFDEAKQIVVARNWEGLVLYDGGYKIGFRTDGKDSPKRPDGCGKWKPEQDGDFIVREVNFRENSRIVCEVKLRQIDPESGREFDCGVFGSFKNKVREELTEYWNQPDPLPLVVELKFDTRYESGKLENKHDFEIRLDKKPENCFSSKSFPKAKYL